MLSQNTENRKFSAQLDTESYEYKDQQFSWYLAPGQSHTRNTA